MNAIRYIKVSSIVFITQKNSRHLDYISAIKKHHLGLSIFIEHSEVNDCYDISKKIRYDEC